MSEILLGLCLVLLLAVAALAFLTFRKTGAGAGQDPAALLRLAAELEKQSDRLDRRLGEGIERLERRLSEEGRQSRQENSEQARVQREDSSRSLKEAGELLAQRSAESAEMQRTRLEDFSARLAELRRSNETTLNLFNEAVLARMTELARFQKSQLGDVLRQMEELRQGNEHKLEEMRRTVEGRLDILREENAAKLEQMRVTVDEKLTGTLEKRLGESFRQVSERLELVHAGLGEMRTLTSGVGDLKRVLSNVKTRGIWGEIQLGRLLEQMLTPDQYATNVVTRPGKNEPVEFAIRLPGRGEGEKPVWLPIDSKFPTADYERLREAADLGDEGAVQVAQRALAATILKSARDIHDKYIEPPHTTDFGILFVPTEGLYAEVLREPGLADTLQRDHRIVVAGPTTLSALLNSLQMGFRTLAIEKRSSEVWQTLGAVKTEFAKFGDVLERLKGQLETASRTIEQMGTRKRTMERKLRSVEALSGEKTLALLGEGGDPETGNGAEEET